MKTLSDSHLDSILIAVDFNEPSLKAATWAARTFSSSRIALVSVVEPPPAAPSLAQRFPSDDTIIDDARRDAEGKLKELSQRIPVSTFEVRVGRPHEQILNAAEDQSADLIVVGRQEVGSAGWARVGAIAQRLLRTSRLPILVVTGDADDAPRKILAAVDESPMTSLVLEWASAVSRQFSAEATAVHVLTSSRSQAETEAAQSWLERQMPESGDAPAIRPRVVAGARRAAEAIIAEARSEGSDLIVIGSHGAGSMSGMAFGSVAESVVVSAGCPVLVAISSRSGSGPG